MATEEDLNKAETEDEQEQPEEAEPAQVVVRTEPLVKTDEAASAAEAEENLEGIGTPVQLGYQRYVYAAYMAGAMLVGFLAAKIGHTSWYRLGQWKPELGEPKDELLYPIAGAAGILVALYYWRKPESRQYANEVAEELSKVTWPSRKEVTNSTTVVVLTTVFATVFFALMDRFWSFITDKIYTF